MKDLAEIFIIMLVVIVGLGSLQYLGSNNENVKLGIIKVLE